MKRRSPSKNNLTRKCVEDLLVQHYDYAANVVGKHIRDPQVVVDIIQEACIKALNGYGRLRDEKHFRSWFVVIALNTMRNMLRGKRRIVNNPAEEYMKFIGYEQDYVQEMARKEMRGLLEAIAETLPMRQRQAFTLRIFDELGFADIAEIMNCPYDTAKGNYQHAVEKIKELVEVL